MNKLDILKMTDVRAQPLECARLGLDGDKFRPRVDIPKLKDGDADVASQVENYFRRDAGQVVLAGNEHLTYDS
jgi:hypothetical protein